MSSCYQLHEPVIKDESVYTFEVVIEWVRTAVDWIVLGSQEVMIAMVV